MGTEGGSNEVGFLSAQILSDGDLDGLTDLAQDTKPSFEGHFNLFYHYLAPNFPTLPISTNLRTADKGKGVS